MLSILPTNTLVFAASDQELVESVAQSLTIPNQNEIRGNITLPKEKNGVSISWQSSHENVISTREVQNPDYASTPAGVVTRGDVDQSVILTATLSKASASTSKVIQVLVKKKLTKPEYVGYLYIHFNEFPPAGSLQQVYFGISKDGVQWTALNNNQSILESTVGDKGARDPYIFRSPEGDKFYMIATDQDLYLPKYQDQWALRESIGSQSLIVWESKDLINWTESRLADVASGIDAGCVWAPEAFYDHSTGEYMIYWASTIPAETNRKLRVFVSRTRDFYTFSEPELFTRYEDAAIDTSMFYEDGKYYRLTKQNNRVVLETSDRAMDYKTSQQVNIGGHTLNTRGDHYTRIDNTVPGCLESYTGPYEGPVMFKTLDDKKYTILVDEYGNEKRGYIPFFTENLDEPNSVKLAANGTYTMTDGAKHGSVIPITQEEYDSLVSKWGVVNEKYSVATQNPIAKYDFEESASLTIKDKSNDNDGQLFGNAKYQYDEEKQSNVLYLDGSTNTYAQLPTSLFDGLNHMSISFDIKLQMPTTQNYHAAISIGQGITKRISVRVRDTQIASMIATRDNVNQKSAEYNTQGLLNQWMNIKLVMDDHTMKIYRNNTLVATQNSVRNMEELGKGLLAYIGKAFYNDPYFKGAFDNIEVYNRALTHKEITGHAEEDWATIEYLSGTGGTIQGTLKQTVLVGDSAQKVTAIPSSGFEFVKWSDGVTTAERTDTPSANTQVTAQFRHTNAMNNFLIADFDFDNEKAILEGALAQAELKGNPTFSTDAVSGKSLFFNGTSDYLNVLKKGGGSLLTGMDEMTISYYSKYDGNNVGWCFYAAPSAVAQPIGGVGKEYYLGVLDRRENVLVERYLNGRTPVISTSYSPETWKHVIIVIEKGKTSIYVNGYKVSNTNSNLLSGILGQNSILQIGKANWGGGEYYQGYLDKFKIYNTALTELELKDLINQEKPVKVESVKLTASKDKIEIGEKLNIQSTVLPDNSNDKRLVWTSSNENIVTVSQEGQIVGVSYGKAIITARALDGSEKSGSIEITVEAKPVAKVTIKYLATEGGRIEGESIQSIEVGSKTKEVKAVATPGYHFVRWSDGLTTITRIDTGVLSAEYTANFEKDVVIQQPPVKGNKVTLNKTKITLGKNEKFKLTAKVLPSNAADQKITWKSSKKDVAKVSSSGQVIAKKVGVTLITASLSNGVKTICKITVLDAPKSIRLNKKKVTLKKGRTYRVTVKLPTKTASNLIQYSSNNNVATVTSHGLIKAKKKGNAKITVKTFNNKKAVITVKVN